jgi:phosphate transport system substrate-binding protein
MEQNQKSPAGIRFDRFWAPRGTAALRSIAVLLTAAIALPTVTSCAYRPEGANTIKITGSDTMVQLAQAWAEAFMKKHPDISVQVKGGGSGIGIAALSSGKIDVATCSRAMKTDEIETAKKNTGKDPKQIKVGLDALAIYVNKHNPIESISIPELAEIYGEQGTFTKWEQLGVDNTACKDGQIIPITRQNSSGTYVYFKEAVLGEKGEYKQGLGAQSGSSDVVNLITNTPCAIGYSGMGYRTPEVKVLKVSKKKGEPGIEPSIETATDGTYPISRPLFLYTLGEPSGATHEFVQWVLSDEGQQIVEKKGYVPLPKK